MGAALPPFVSFRLQRRRVRLLFPEYFCESIGDLCLRIQTVTVLEEASVAPRLVTRGCCSLWTVALQHALLGLHVGGGVHMEHREVLLGSITIGLLALLDLLLLQIHHFLHARL